MQQLHLNTQMESFDDNPESDSVSQLRPSPQKKNKTKASYGPKKRTYKQQQVKIVEQVVDGGTAVFKSSLWRLDQNIAYMRYLIEYEQLFYASRNQRKNMKINVLMSEFIKSRSPDQCRSHHQKMIKYHGDIPNIIVHIKALETRQQQKKTESSINLSPQIQPSLITPEQDGLRSLSVDVVMPTGELDSWMIRTEILEQDRQMELWLDGVEDKYGNL